MAEPGPVILIASCRAYSDLWAPLHRAFELFWPDCPYEIVLATDQRGDVSVPPGWLCVEVGSRQDWSATLLNAVRSLRAEYCFLWIEDLFPLERVDTPRVKQVFDLAIANGWSYLRLNGRPWPPRFDLASGNIGRLPEGDQYRTSTVMALWRTEVLADLLLVGESAWRFETGGAARSDRFSEFYCAREPAIEFRNAVLKGRWDPRVLKVLRRLRVLGAADIQRPVMSWHDVAWRIAKDLLLLMFNLVPRRHRRGLHMKIKRY